MDPQSQNLGNQAALHSMEKSSQSRSQKKIIVIISLLTILCLVFLIFVLIIPTSQKQISTNPQSPYSSSDTNPVTITTTNPSGGIIAPTSIIINQSILFSAVRGTGNTAQSVLLLSPTGKATVLNASSDPSGFQGGYNATFSPDLKKIAFVTLKGTSLLAIMNSDGNGKQVVSRLAGQKLMPSWSPDGQKILYMLRKIDTGSGIVQLDLNTKTETLLPNTQNAQSASWLPDNSGYSFINLEQTSDGTKVRNHLMVFKNNTVSEIKALYNGSVIDNIGSPSYSPSGKQVAFTRDSDNQIYLMGNDGNNVQILTTQTAAKPIFSCPSWSADGSYILADEIDQTTNKEFISKITVVNGTISQLPITGYSRANCPRVARY